jgi:hypothetical protein
MRIRAVDRVVERWLDEGWSPWRIGYGVLGLVTLAVAVYGYLGQPRHRNVAVIAGIAIIAVWALLEMARWRIRYKRLSAVLAAIPVTESQNSESVKSKASATLRAIQASSRVETAERLRKLLGDGRVLHANLASTAPWGWHMPAVLPGRIARWETDVCEALRNKSETYREFLNAPDWDPSAWDSRPVYDRITYQLEVLEKAVNADTQSDKPVVS